VAEALEILGDDFDVKFNDFARLLPFSISGRHPRMSSLSPSKDTYPSWIYEAEPSTCPAMFRTSHYVYRSNRTIVRGITR
jgi:hypothetical protein